MWPIDSPPVGLGGGIELQNKNPIEHCLLAFNSIECLLDYIFAFQFGDHPPKFSSKKDTLQVHEFCIWWWWWFRTATLSFSFSFSFSVLIHFRMLHFLTHPTLAFWKPVYSRNITKVITRKSRRMQRNYKCFPFHLCCHFLTLCACLLSRACLIWILNSFAFYWRPVAAKVAGFCYS